MSQDKHRGKHQRQEREKPEFDQAIIDLARVTRVTKGGKHLSFRACVLIGDRRGRVGYGVDKGADVQIAVEKAVNQARKNMITVPFDVTIPHRVEAKYKAAAVMIKPAPQGSGIIAGSSIRSVLEMAGVPNASAKKLGKSGNKIANIKATFEALKRFKPSAVNAMYNKRNQHKAQQQPKPVEQNKQDVQSEKKVVVEKKALVAKKTHVEKEPKSPNQDASIKETK
ncbi:MAG: 30S ribosomal protein S5 [Candidatus Magasanikbacteria bacterium]